MWIRPYNYCKGCGFDRSFTNNDNYRISGLPVVESNSGTLAGIIIKTDIVKGIASYSK